METRRIGTQLKVSSIALGGNIFGRFTNERETQSIFKEAKDCGINFVDTADVYSEGTSEELVGKCIKGDRDYWVIATKVGIPSNGTCSGLGKREKIISACEGSLKRLEIETIDLYQMHNYDPETPLDETLSALDELQKQGKIKEFGVSNYTIDHLLNLRSRLQEFPGLKCVTLQTPFNAFFRGAEDRLIPLCMKQGIGILPYNVLARGVLTDKYLNNVIPEGSRAQVSESVRNAVVPEVLERVREFKKIADSSQMAVSQVVLAWTLAQRGIRSIPLGMRTPEQVRENAKAADMKLDSNVYSQIEDIVRHISHISQYPLTSNVAQFAAK